MTSLAGQANQAQNPLQTTRQRSANINHLDNWLAIHVDSHEKTLTIGCPYCTCRAINSLESNGIREDVAREFLAKTGASAVLEDVREVRTALGNDAFGWMFKEEYLR